MPTSETVYLPAIFHIVILIVLHLAVSFPLRAASCKTTTPPARRKIDSAVGVLEDGGHRPTCVADRAEPLRSPLIICTGGVIIAAACKFGNVQVVHYRLPRQPPSPP